jgi:conjugal transfer pilus assembly protein TraD
LTQTPENKNSSDHTLYFLVIIFVVALLAKKLNELKPIVVHWIESHLWLTAGLAAGFGLVLATAGYAGLQILNDKRKLRRYIESVTSNAPGSVYAGRAESGERIFIPIEARKMHTQVIGTTNAGKSESVIIPWAIGDMKDNRGFVIVDGKADKSFIHKMFSYAKKLNRLDDFKVFSLQDPGRSQTFNPLLGGTPEEVAERVFNSFEFDNSYYESVQYEIFSQVLRIFDKAKVRPTFLRVYQAIKSPTALHEMAIDGKDETLIRWASGFKSIPPSDREERTSGLLASLSHFAFGTHAKLFNTDAPDIDLDQALKESELIYFQLPVLKAAFLGKATGKLVLQCLQSAVANRHGEDAEEKDENEVDEKEHPFFSVYLDDFTEYLYPGFVTLLNKSRSANIGVVFAHQALGDIKALGDDVATSILTNSNLKIIMRGNDPDSAEYFSKVIGTKSGEQMTERAESGALGRSRTGQGSIREVEEFIVHPNVIKRNLGVGEALVIIPHRYGTKTVKVKFAMLPSLQRLELPRIAEKPVLGLDIKSAREEKANPALAATTDSTSAAFSDEQPKLKEVA